MIVAGPSSAWAVIVRDPVLLVVGLAPGETNSSTPPLIVGDPVLVVVGPSSARAAVAANKAIATAAPPAFHNMIFSF
jgi:hypothetical protein